MNRACIVIAAALFVSGGCASGGGEANDAQPATPRGPAEPRGGPTPGRPAAPANAPSANAPSAGTAAPAAATAGPTIPAGARYTIYCDSITTPDHVARATALRDALAKNASARDWYVIHQAGESSIYHGYYREIDPKSVAAKPADRSAAQQAAADRADAQRALRDKQLVDALPNPTVPDRKLFPGALFMPLDAPDPTAPPDWSLTNARGYWSVQVAAFTGAERKANAVEAVREARQVHNVIAYYYHGPTASSVCVGSWPAEAVRGAGAQAAAARANATPQDVGVRGGRDERDPLVVNLTGQQLSPEERRDIEARGGNVHEFAAGVEIMDPTLQETLLRYPEHAVDGQVQTSRQIDKKTGKEINVPRPSMIVPIPRDGAGEFVRGTDRAQPGAPNVPAAPSGGTSDLGQRLRGIGR